MAIIRRRIASVKGLQDALDAKVAIDGILDDYTEADGTETYDDKVVSANEIKQELDDRISKSSISSALDSDSEETVASSKAAKDLKDQIDSLTGGVVYKGTFDASGDKLPSDVKTGWLYKISVAGTIDGLEMAVGDSIYANKDVDGDTAGADWNKTDNTESADILREGDISDDDNWDNDTDKLSDRETIKKYVDDAVSEVSTKFVNEKQTISDDKFTLDNQPLDNCIFTGVASVDNEDGTFDIVECSVDDNAVVTLAVENAGEYDDKKATVTYAYNA